jgi:uncharacterized LabA/DUF88 family protein
LKKTEPNKLKRHQEYITALKSVGVDVREGYFKTEKTDCRECGNVWDQPQEKQSDVNLALEIIGDAFNDIYDTAYMVTADSDQGAVIAHVVDKKGCAEARNMSQRWDGENAALSPE